MRFFLTNLGDQKLILGYPWFAAIQPNVDWARAWIDYDQLPVVLRTPNSHRAVFTKKMRGPVPRRIDWRRCRTQKATQDRWFIGRVMMEPHQIASVEKRQTLASKLAQEARKPEPTPLPTPYQQHAHVFSEQEAQRFLGPRIWDHAIELKPDAPPTLPGKVYALTQDEQKALQDFIEEHVQKGYIRPSKSPYAAPFFFIKKKDGRLRPV
jgi:hypothetical protein